MDAVSSINKEDRLFAQLLSFGELMKPELTGLSVLTSLFGLFLGAAGTASGYDYAILALGTLLVGGGAGALNQWIERDYDLLMKRTERRPLPSGRLSHLHALVFGVVTTVLGNALLFTYFGPATGVLGSATSILYLFVYTPLKRRTWHNTAVGAVPGALPVLIGWAASGAALEAGAWLLFAIVFIWQFPHFLSLAWLYRKDYAKAGFQMLSVIDSDEGKRTSRWNLSLSLALIGASFGLAAFQDLGWWYAGGAIVSNGVLCWSAVMAFGESRRVPVTAQGVNRSARLLFLASLLYLPVLMGSALVDRL